MSETHAAERHASWLELFFDLTVVAAAIQVSHRLHDAESLGQVAVCAALFYAVWSAWTALSVYANVAGERARQRSLLLGMFGMCVMVAAIPGAFPEVLPEDHVMHRTVAFVVAFMVVRSIASGSVQDLGKVVAFWPAAQGLMVLPWILLLVFDGPARWWLLGAGVAADVGISMMSGRNQDLAERMAERARAHQERRPRRGQPLTIEAADAEPHHLDERLGLFVIIVLGEALAQITGAASGLEWTADVVAVSVAGFGILVAIWYLVDNYGSSGAPRTPGAVVPPWLALPAHLLVTGGIVGMAAGLGLLTAHSAAVTETNARWYLFGGLAAYLLAAAMTGPAGGAQRRWLFAFALPGLLACIVLGIVAEPLAGWASACAALVVLVWQVLSIRVLPVRVEGVKEAT